MDQKESVDTSSAHHHVVNGAQAGERLSHVVALIVPGLSRRAAKELVDRGRVFVNENREKKASFILSAGQRLEVHDVHQASVRPSLCWEDLLWQGDDLIIVNKPAGLLVHGRGKEEGRTLLPLLRQLLQQKGQWKKADRLKLVHRLDRDTSGVLVVARREKAAMEMERLFRQRKVSKQYQVLVEGVPEQRQFRQFVDVHVKRPEDDGDFSPRSGSKGRYHPRGKPSRTVTHFKVLERYCGSARLAAFPLSGRTHQIRIHLARYGYPVLGDIVYGHTHVRYKLFRAIPRQMLHAESLEFVLPITGRELQVKAPLPADMSRVLGWLKNPSEL